MATRTASRYVQSFSTGLSQLLQNHVGTYGPTLAITHFLPVYIPSLHNSDFGGGFTDLFNNDTDIGATGFRGEPLWLPTDTFKYEYKSSNFNNITANVDVKNTPVSGAVSSADPSACWVNAIRKNDNFYTLSQTTGVVGSSGWNWVNDPAFYDYDGKLTIDNLFPIKDYEAPLNSDNTVCGRYIVGFKDIATKLGLTNESTQLTNILNSTFVYNAVILYGFNVQSITTDEDGQIKYQLSDTAIPVAIAGIEGQPITLNMNKMSTQGNEWDSVWNIDIDFIPYTNDNVTHINTVTSRIVSEWSYWSKNQPDTIHTNNKIHVGMTVEPYGNSDQTNRTSAWLHISNKIVDPEQFDVGSDTDYTRVPMDRRHIRMDSDKTLVTLEMKDLQSPTSDRRGVLDVNFFAIDSYSAGKNPQIDINNPFVQVNGGKAFGSNDMAVGVGVNHVNTQNSVSVGKNIGIGGVGYKNTVMVGSDVDANDNLSKTQNKNIISVGDNFRHRGSNLVKVGTTSRQNDVAGEESNILMVGDNQDSYIGMRSSLLIGSHNNFSSKYGDAEYTDGKTLLVMGEGNELSTGDYFGEEITSTTVSGSFSWSVKLNGGAVSALSGVSALYTTEEGYQPTVVENGELIGTFNRVHGQGANLINWKVKGTNNQVILSGGTSDMFEVVGSLNSLEANQVSKIKINGFSNTVRDCNSNVLVEGSNNIVRGNYIHVEGTNNEITTAGCFIHLEGQFGTLGKYEAFNSIRTPSMRRYGKNIFAKLVNADVGAGENAMMVLSGSNVRENSNSVAIGNATNINAMRVSMATVDNCTIDTLVNSVVNGRNITVYGSSSLLGKVRALNTLAIGSDLSLSNSVTNTYANVLGQVIHASRNSVVVGSTFDLKNVENGVYVGENIRSYGKQGFAFGKNIFLHIVDTKPIGNIGAIGTDIHFGADGDPTRWFSKNNLGDTTTVVIGDSIDSSGANSYYNVYGNNDGKNFISVPSLVVANNAYGNKSFAPSWGGNMLRIGKWIQQYEIRGEENYYEGTSGWKMPYASLMSLSNATEFKVNLPVIEYQKVFGVSTFNTENKLATFDVSSGVFNDMLFVDEYGFVRQKTGEADYQWVNHDKIDIWKTLLSNSTLNTYAIARNEELSLTEYNNCIGVLNEIITYIQDDINVEPFRGFNGGSKVSSTEENHFHNIVPYKPNFFYYNQCGQFNGAILSLCDGFSMRYSNVLYNQLSTVYGVGHTHNQDKFHNMNISNSELRCIDVSLFPRRYKVASTIMAIAYYLNNSVIVKGNTHVHVPCLIEKLT